MGFEPTVDVTADSRFRGGRLRPLSHASNNTRGGGDGRGGIRTRDGGFPPCRFSKPVPSAPRPPIQRRSLDPSRASCHSARVMTSSLYQLSYPACPRRDSNSDAVRHCILSAARLPKFRHGDLRSCEVARDGVEPPASLGVIRGMSGFLRGPSLPRQEKHMSPPKCSSRGLAPWSML